MGLNAERHVHTVSIKSDLRKPRSWAFPAAQELPAEFLVSEWTRPPLCPPALLCLRRPRLQRRLVYLFPSHTPPAPHSPLWKTEPSRFRKIRPGGSGRGRGTGHRRRGGLALRPLAGAVPSRRPWVRAKARPRDTASESLLGNKGEHPTAASRLRLWVAGCGRGSLCPSGKEEAGLAFNLVVGTIHMTIQGPAPAGPLPPTIFSPL